MSHAKRCPQCGFVGSYETAQLLVCEGCGEVLAESWALGDAVTDIMDEGSWIHQFRQAEGPGLAARTPPDEDGIPGLIGPGSASVTPRAPITADAGTPGLIGPPSRAAGGEARLVADAAIPGLLGPARAAPAALELFAAPRDAAGPAAPSGSVPDAPRLPPFPASPSAARALALTDDLQVPSSKAALDAKPATEPRAPALAAQPSALDAKPATEPRAPALAAQPSALAAASSAPRIVLGRPPSDLLVAPSAPRVGAVRPGPTAASSGATPARGAPIVSSPTLAATRPAGLFTRASVRWAIAGIVVLALLGLWLSR